MGSCSSKAVVVPEGGRRRASAARAAAQQLLAGTAPAEAGEWVHHGRTAKAALGDASSAACSPLSLTSAACDEHSQHSVASGVPGPSAAEPRRRSPSAQEAAALRQGVTLGRVIGCYGSSLLHRGTFRQQHVVVMVTDLVAEDDQEADRLEARLRSIAGRPELEHPNLVKVLHCATERLQLPGGADCGAVLARCVGGRMQEADCSDDEESGGWQEAAVSGCDAAPHRTHLQVWTVSELCGQGTLETAIARGWLRAGSSALGKAEAGPDLPAILATAQEIAAALAHLHAHGFAHGELTSGHVLLSHAPGTRPFTAKLTSACHLACHKALARSQQALRLDTAVYTAPEVLLGGSTQHTPASNVHAFGVLLHEMYSGQLAWDTLQGKQVVRDMLAGRRALPPLEGCPPSYQALILACTAPHAGDRPSMQSVLSSLQLLQAKLL